MRTRLLLPLLVLAACGKDDEAVSVSEVNGRTSAIVGQSARNIAEAFVSLGNLSTWSSAAAALDNLDLAFASVPALSPTVSQAPAAEPMPPPPDQADAGTAPPLDPAQTEADIRAALERYIFNEASLESSDAESATFRIRGELVCGTVTSCNWDACDGTDPACFQQPLECTESVDQACIDAVNALEIRVVARPVGEDGIDLTIQVGPTRAAPIALALRPSSITIDIDLAGAKSAVEQIAALSGAQADLPRVMLGKLRFSLAQNGAQDVSLAASVLEAIAIEVDGANGATRLDAAPAAGFSMRAQGLIGRLSMDFVGGAVDLSMPYADVTPAGSGSGVFAVHAGGASWAVVLDEGQQSLGITNIGLGDSSLTVKKDETTLFSLDLNPTSGRRFALDITPDAAAGSALFTVTPELDLQELFALGAIAADFPDIEPYFYDESYRILLAGSGSASVLPRPADYLTGWQGGLEVVSGTLTLSSSAAAQAVVVNAGECLTGTDTPPAGSHPLLGHFVVTTCP